MDIKRNERGVVDAISAEDRVPAAGDRCVHQP
jgi:hypothetical protein